MKEGVQNQEMKGKKWLDAWIKQFVESMGSEDQNYHLTWNIKLFLLC